MKDIFLFLSDIGVVDACGVQGDILTHRYNMKWVWSASLIPQAVIIALCAKTENPIFWLFGNFEWTLAKSSYAIVLENVRNCCCALCPLTSLFVWPFFRQFPSIWSLYPIPYFIKITIFSSMDILIRTLGVCLSVHNVAYPPDPTMLI